MSQPLLCMEDKEVAIYLRRLSNAEWQTGHLRCQAWLCALMSHHSLLANHNKVSEDACFTWAKDAYDYVHLEQQKKQSEKCIEYATVRFFEKLATKLIDWKKKIRKEQADNIIWHRKQGFIKLSKESLKQEPRMTYHMYKGHISSIIWFPISSLFCYDIKVCTFRTKWKCLDIFKLDWLLAPFDHNVCNECYYPLSF